MKLSIVIPAYNEEATLRQSLGQIRAVLREIGMAYELVVIDDGSSDGTWGLLQDLVSLDDWRGRLHGVRFSRNFGKEAAIVAGLQQAVGDAVIVMDADLQHPPSLLPRMVELWSRGPYLVAEVVKRRRQRESFLRRLAARSFYRILMLGTAMDLRGSTDFKLLDRRVVEEYLRLPETGRFFRGLTTWLALPTAQLQIEIPDRQEGATSWSFNRLIALARGSVVSMTSLPLRLISWIGLTGFLSSVFITAQTLWNKWVSGSEAGFPTVIILILGMGSLILISLGIIGEYLSAMYTEIKRRPAYVVRDVLPLQTDADGGQRSSTCDDSNTWRRQP